MDTVVVWHPLQASVVTPFITVRIHSITPPLIYTPIPITTVPCPPFPRLEDPWVTTRIFLEVLACLQSHRTSPRWVVCLLMKYRKIPKKASGLIFFKSPFGGTYFWRGLSTEGNLRFKIYWASLIVGINLLFCFVLLRIWRQFSKYKPPRGLYLEGRFNGGFFALRVWGAYIWRGLFSEFYANEIGFTKLLLNIG